MPTCIRRQNHPCGAKKLLDAAYKISTKNNLKRLTLLSLAFSLNIIVATTTKAEDIIYTKAEIINILKSKGYKSYYAESIKARTIISDKKKFFFDINGKDMLILSENGIVSPGKYEIENKGKYGRLCADLGDGNQCYSLFEKKNTNKEDDLALVIQSGKDAYSHRELRKIEYRDKGFYEYSDQRERELYEFALNNGELKENVDKVYASFQLYAFTKMCTDDGIFTSELLDNVKDATNELVKKLKNPETKDKIWDISSKNSESTVNIIRMTQNSIQKYKTCDNIKGAVLSIKKRDATNPF